MNFSHGSYEYHQSVIDNTRAMVARMFIFIPSILITSPLTPFPRESRRTPSCDRTGYRMSWFHRVAQDLSLIILQKGPEIRTGLTKEQKDVRHTFKVFYK